jgi:hypothetical protein
MNRLLLLLLATAVLAVPAASLAHAPGTDGGPADQGCAPIANAGIYVGASDVSCSVARRVARNARRGGHNPNRWFCRGSTASFGHCHGIGVRRGATVHWAVND